MDWYYVDGGKSVGPVSEEKLVGLIQKGKVTPDTLIWQNGMPEWKPCGEVGPKPAAGAPPPLADLDEASFPSPHRRLSFHGDGGTLFGIHLVNTFLTLVTLGVYFFWGRVKLRKYLWGQLEFDGDRLSYHGTGKETFLGWLKAALFFGIPYLLASHLPRWMGAKPKWVIVGGVVASLLFLWFIPIAIVGTRRYRLSRTAWRGIRFSFRGHWKNYLPIFWGGGLLNALTLGFYIPFFDAKRDKFLVSQSYVGNKNFDYDGKGEGLFKSFLAAWFLFFPTLGFSALWYHVRRTRYLWEHTTLGESRFSCTITFGSFFLISFTNALLVLVTLGFGFPWAQARFIRYMTENLALNGPVDLDTIRQEAQTVGATGEELGSFLDLDFDLG